MDELEQENREYRLPGSGPTLHNQVFHLRIEQGAHNMDQTIALVRRERLVRRILEDVRVIDGLQGVLRDAMRKQLVPSFTKYRRIKLVLLIVIVIDQPQIAVQKTEMSIGGHILNYR